VGASECLLALPSGLETDDLTKDAEAQTPIEGIQIKAGQKSESGSAHLRRRIRERMHPEAASLLETAPTRARPEISLHYGQAQRIFAS